MHLRLLILLVSLSGVYACSLNPQADSQLGPRPFYLLEQMPQGALKQKLMSCRTGPFYPSKFSIGHRGAPLQFPEHSQQSYQAAAVMGAGIIECDVTFTQDKQLVCRHDQCDLHTTTDILIRPELAAKCAQPFTAATENKNASAVCCTTDITLAEYKSLCGKMDAFNPRAKTAKEFQQSPIGFRTELYASCATVLSHKESIKLIKELDRGFTPELKTPRVPMPYQNEYTQQDFIQQTIQEYREAGVPANQVWIQSFKKSDIDYLIKEYPEFAQQAFYLDNRGQSGFKPSLADFKQLYQEGFRIIAPPMQDLLQVDAKGNIVPSSYAIWAKAAGLQLITWTFERSGRMQADMLSDGSGSDYYASIATAVKNDGDVYRVLDVLAQEVGVLGLFSDWPGTVTFYANCMGLD